MRQIATLESRETLESQETLESREPTNPAAAAAAAVESQDAAAAAAAAVESQEPTAAAAAAAAQPHDSASAATAAESAWRSQAVEAKHSLPLRKFGTDAVGAQPASDTHSVHADAHASAVAQHCSAALSH